MTCIIHGVKTKTELKQAVADQNNGKPRSDIWIEDPSLFRPMAWSLCDMAQRLPHTQASCVITNHPKRSWFAKLYCHALGGLKVE